MWVEPHLIQDNPKGGLSPPGLGLGLSPVGKGFSSCKSKGWPLEGAGGGATPELTPCRLCRDLSRTGAGPALPSSSSHLPGTSVPSPLWYLRHKLSHCSCESKIATGVDKDILLGAHSRTELGRRFSLPHTTFEITAWDVASAAPRNPAEAEKQFSKGSDPH